MSTRRRLLAGLAASPLLGAAAWAAQGALRVGDQKGGAQSVMNVATLKGQTGHSLVLAALRRAGLRADDVRLVFIAPSEAKSVLAAGSVDAWATWGPY